MARFLALAFLLLAISSPSLAQGIASNGGAGIAANSTSSGVVVGGTAGNLPVIGAGGTLVDGGFTPSTMPILATGSVQPRTLAARAADSLNLPDYILSTDTDATAGINRAVARAIAIGQPQQIWIPCGSYAISSNIAITTAANQGVVIDGAGAACVTIQQNADADVFDVSLTNYGGIFGTGAFRISGIKFVMAGTASTTRTAVSVSATAASGAAGVPLYLDDLTFASGSSSYWGSEIAITQIPDAVYISHINGYFQNQNGNHITLSGNATSYTTSAFLRDTFMVGGSQAIVLGNYLQGIHLTNVNVLNAATALYSIPTAGLNEEINISDSYLMGQTVLTSTTPGLLSQVKIHGTYFDGIGLTTSNITHVAISGVGTLDLDGDTFNGPGASKGANVIGLSLSGTITPAIIKNDAFTGYLNGGTGLSVNVSTYVVAFGGLQFVNNTNNISDTTSGTTNTYTDTLVGNQGFLYGGRGNGIQCVGGGPGSNTSTCATVGVDANIQNVYNAKGLPGTDWTFRDGLSRAIIQLRDSGSSASGTGINIGAAVNGVSPSIGPTSSTFNFMLGANGVYATTATAPFPQIPYMAGKPTGVPATTGGASIVYDTTDKELCLYNPTGVAWNCSPAFPN